jgi:hypothetical protein
MVYYKAMYESGNRILAALFLLIWILAAIHIAAESYFWYWTYRWLDIPMHVFGGMWLGLGVLWLKNHTGYVRGLWQRLPKSNLAVALCGGLCIGLVWEAYEYTIWQYIGTGLPPQYGPDTQLDLLMDATGAMLGYLAYRFLAPKPASSESPA